MRYRQGEITLNEFGIKAALNLSPLVGKGIGAGIGKWISPTAGESIDNAVNVYEHQLGNFDVLKSIFYDPSK
jgi:hypothetical protein